MRSFSYLQGIWAISVWISFLNFGFAFQCCQLPYIVNRLVQELPVQMDMQNIQESIQRIQWILGIQFPRQLEYVSHRILPERNSRQFQISYLYSCIPLNLSNCQPSNHQPPEVTFWGREIVDEFGFRNSFAYYSCLRCQLWSSGQQRKRRSTLLLGDPCFCMLCSSRCK